MTEPAGGVVGSVGSVGQVGSVGSVAKVSSVNSSCAALTAPPAREAAGSTLWSMTVRAADGAPSDGRRGCAILANTTSAVRVWSPW